MNLIFLGIFDEGKSPANVSCSVLNNFASKEIVTQNISSFVKGIVIND